MGSFVFKWPHPDASDVHVTGTFDNWSKSESLNKVGAIWEKEVTLPKADEKILYKFVVNDKWVIDHAAPQEDDGHGNVNNVLYPDQIKPKAAIVPEAVTTSSAAPASTTAALAGQVPLEPKKQATEVTPATETALNNETTKSSLPGAFPDTPMTEPDSFSVNPIPATAGAGNPVDVPAGGKLPAPGDVTTNTVDSTVTTSKEDYEKAGSTLPFVGAVAGVGAGILTAAGISSGKKENIIPESSLPMGADAGKTLDAGPIISSAGVGSTTADLAGKVPLEEKKAATVIDPQTTTETVPALVKESIAKAHTDPEATTSVEAVKEKAQVEQEILGKIPSSNQTGEPAPTLAAATSATAPGTTVPGTSSVAAAAIADGTDGTATPTTVPKTTVPAEKSEGDTTEYAPPVGAPTAPGVSPAAGAAVSDGAEDPTLAEEPAVKMMNQNEAESKGVSPSAGAGAAAPTTVAAAVPAAKDATPAAAKKDVATTPATSTAPSTPSKKPPTTTPTGSPASAGKEKKRKNRISSLFKKIFD